MTSQTSYDVIALFVNMVFSDKDKSLIKQLYQLKGCNVRQLRTEFLDKNGRQVALTGCPVLTVDGLGFAGSSKLQLAEAKCCTRCPCSTSKHGDK